MQVLNLRSTYILSYPQKKKIVKYIRLLCENSRNLSTETKMPKDLGFYFLSSHYTTHYTTHLVTKQKLTKDFQLKTRE